ncbi:PAS domain S-box protein [Rhodospirillum sp. A1_3_36]|uniref:PAS domain-containing sensor histidine kinase n=1 Tax=Rhodospirillum sp. A1_3_36 TaxID=3391666 RepID=UPI0039A5FA93
MLVLILVCVTWILVKERESDLRDAHLRLTEEAVELAHVLDATLSGAGAIARQVALDTGATLALGKDPDADRFKTRLAPFVADVPGLVGIAAHSQSGRLLAQVIKGPLPEHPFAPPSEPESWSKTPESIQYQILGSGPSLLRPSLLRPSLLRPSLLRLVSPMTGDTGAPLGTVSILIDIDALLTLQSNPKLCRQFYVNDAILASQGACSKPSGTTVSDSDTLVSTSRVESSGTLTIALSMSRDAALKHWTHTVWISLVGFGGFALFLAVALITILRKVAHRIDVQERKDRDNAQLAAALTASGLGTWAWRSSEGTGEMSGGGLEDEILDGTNWLDRILPRDRLALMAALEAQERGLATPLDIQVRCAFKDGSIRWLRFRGRLIPTGQHGSTGQDGEHPPYVAGLWADVTDQSQVAMERLRLATAVEKGPVAVMMTDAEGRIDYVNHKFQDVMGYTPSDVLGQYPEMIGSGLTDPSVITDLWSRVSQGRDWSGEIINRHKNGHLAWHLVSISPIQSDDAVIGYVAVYEDISERKRLQEDLNMQVSMMRAVLDISPNGILVADLQGRPRMINLRLRRLWGLDPDVLETEEPGFLFETMAKKVAEPQTFLEVINSLNEAPREPEVGLEIMFRDGRVIERHSLAVEDDTGTPWGRVWFFREVTEQKRVERALSDQLEFQHTLLDTLPSPVFHMDRQERFLGCNRAFGTLVSRSPEAVFGATADELFSQERARRLTEGNRDLLTNGGMDIREITLMDSEGVFRDMAMSKAAFTDAQGQVNGLVGILTDVSNLKKATDELRRSNQDLEQFAYVASHDLQEPLRMVSSYLGLLKRRYADHLDDDAVEFIGYAVDGAHRMQDLIQDLLHFSRIDTRGNPLEPTSTRLCLDMAMNNLRVSFEEANAQLVCLPLPMVMADDAQITSLFQNLLSNAVKYRAPDRTPDIRIQVTQDGDYWRFAVSDNGIGIAPQFADKVFMIFQRLQTRDRYPGTGIGLAVVKKIVERHGGRVWLEGEEGVGTTFYFTLRAIPEELAVFKENLA